MKLTDLELVSLIDLHARQLPDLACDVVHGVADIYRAIERIRELVALLPVPVMVAEEGQRLQ